MRRVALSSLKLQFRYWKAEKNPNSCILWLLQPSNHLGNFLLGRLQIFYVSLEVGAARTELQVQPDICQVQQDNHIPWSAGSTLADAVQDLFAFIAAGVHCWLVSLLCTRTPWAYSTELLPTQSVHSLYCYVGLYQMQNFIFVKPCAFFVGPSLAYLCMVALHSGPSTSPPSSVSLTKFVCVQYHPDRLKILNSTRRSTSPWGTPLMTDYHFAFEPLHCFEQDSLASSPPILWSICQVHILPACQQRRGTVCQRC